jgi:hypothetical protein
MIIRRSPLLVWRAIAMHFRDDADRDGKQNNDIDGCNAYNVIEVDSGY